jgi:hypothetical protein
MNATQTSNGVEADLNGVEADLKKIAKVGRGKRDLILVAALVVVGGLIGLVGVGFHGTQVSRSAAAMTIPATPSPPPTVPR